MSLEISEGQKNATQRTALYGAVYALSGTLLSRVSGLASAPIRWATRTFSGGPSSDLYEAYLGPPDTIQEELAFKLGDPSPNHPINIPVRNLPFRHTESLLAAIVDEEYAWEGSTATLYVGYLEPGKSPEDLAPADWTPIRKLGQFGSPQDAQQDGFRLPLLSRDSLRRQTLNFKRAERADWPNIDPADEGRVIPIIIGAPEGWTRMIRVDAGVYGFTVASTLSGTASGLYLQTDFPPEMVSGLQGGQVYVHRQDKLLTIQSVTDLRQTPGERAPWFLTFNGGFLNFNIPQGALIQEKKTTYRFLPAANPLIGTDSSISNFGGITSLAFETYDGRVIPLAFRRLFNSNFEDVTSGNAPWGVWNFWDLYDDDSTTPPGQPPALIPRLNLPSTGADIISDVLNITSQPEFSSSVSNISATKQNYPTGPGAASAAFDGSLNTGYSLGSFGSVTFTFPSVPGGSFGNTDTVRSILRFTSQGDITVSDGGFTVFANPTGSKDSYTIVLGTAEEFNQSVRFTAAVGGGIVYEVDWEHELEAELTIDRTTDVDGDVDIVLESADDVGFDMVPIRGILAKMDANNDAGFIAGTRFGDSPFAQYPVGFEGTFPFERRVTYPEAVFANLQKKYLEDGGNFSDVVSDYSDFINMASYSGAAAEYHARNMRFNFAIVEPMTWTDLERTLALQCRSHAFYGPNGHQLIFIPDSAEALEQTVEATFLLPGTANPNAAQAAGSPLIERTSPSVIFNRVQIYWSPEWYLGDNVEVAKRFQKFLIGENQTSIDVFGSRYDTDGPVEAWALSEQSYLTSGGAYSAAEQVQDLADFIADRQGFAKTRFVFETGWRAFGLTQGSIIRVAFAPAQNVFRNIVCEVEDIKTSPINAEQRILTVRSLGAPQRGSQSALIWTDLFTEVGDTWAARFTGAHDSWQNYFGVP